MERSADSRGIHHSVHRRGIERAERTDIRNPRAESGNRVATERIRKMWGKPPFFIAANFSVEVRNLANARHWYKERLGLREASTSRKDGSGLPFVDLRVSKENEFITLIEAEPGQSVTDARPMLFTRNLHKAYGWLAAHGVALGPVQCDSGGNRFFQFQDMDGNKIEVCVEP